MGQTLWDLNMGPCHLPLQGCGSPATVVVDLQHTLTGVKGDQEGGTLGSGKSGRTGLKVVIDRYFQETIYELGFLLIPRKALKSLTDASAPRDRRPPSCDQRPPSAKMCARLALTPFPKTTNTPGFLLPLRSSS